MAKSIELFTTTDALEFDDTFDEKPSQTGVARLRFDGTRFVITTDKREYAIVLVELDTAKTGKPNLADLLTDMEI